jgi:ProP effector
MLASRIGLPAERHRPAVTRKKIKIAVNNPFTKFSDTWIRRIRHRKLADDALMGTAIDGRNQEAAVKMSTKSDTNIAALAALFPAAFAAEPWQAHRPLKVGIGKDLVARGVFGAREVNATLKRYVDRLTYQKCLAAGGARVDLDGNAAGEVSSEQRCRAERMVGRSEARQLAEAAAAKVEAVSKAVRKAAAPPLVLDGRVIVISPPAETKPSTGSGRLGLADLKRAAQERRARQEANRAGFP